MNIFIDQKPIRLFDQVVVMAWASVGVLLFELFFKWKIIFSNGLILDDTFMFERGIHKRPFNDLSDFIPAFDAVDFDSSVGLILFRFLIEITDDIVILRITYLGLLAFACGLFSLLIFRVTRDRQFSIIAGIFSFITPFTPILVLFTNGSYNIIYFIFFFMALLCGSFVSPARPPVQTTLLIIAMTVLLLLSSVLVMTGVLLSLAAIVWMFVNSGTYKKIYTRRLFFLSTSMITIHGAWTVLTSSSPYEAMPGRVDYGFETLFVNGLSIINRSVSSYINPMMETGTLTTQSQLWASIGFISAITGLYIVGFFKAHRKVINLSKLKSPLAFALFLSICVVLSIGPYASLTRTHLWHYFPHMIFICSMTYLLIYFFLGKRSAYSVLAISALLTTYTYTLQIPNYENTVKEQRLFANFVYSENKTWLSKDRVFLIYYGKLTGGLSQPFRSTGVNRYISDNADGPVLVIMKNTAANHKKIEEKYEQGRTYIYKMEANGAFEMVD